MTVVSSILVMAFSAMAAHAESGDARALVEKGNTFYRMGLFEEAGRKYLEAESISADSPIITYNLGNVYHQKLLEKQGSGDMPAPFEEVDPEQQELVDKAVDAYKHALQSSSPTLCGQALYNLGNTYAAAGMVNEAILSYCEALRLLPDDQDTKHNLELLLLQKKVKREMTPLEIIHPQGLTNIIKMTGLTGPGTNSVKRGKGRGMSSAEADGGGAQSQGQGSGNRDKSEEAQSKALVGGGEGEGGEGGADVLGGLPGGLKKDKAAVGPVAMPMQSNAQGVGVREGGGALEMAGTKSEKKGDDSPAPAAEASTASDPGGSGAQAAGGSIAGGEDASVSKAKAVAGAAETTDKKVSKDSKAAGGGEASSPGKTASSSDSKAPGGSSDYEAAPPRVTRDGRPLNRAAKSTLDRANKLEGKYTQNPHGSDEPFLQPAAQDW